jgi:hypothetical protein
MHITVYRVDLHVTFQCEYNIIISTWVFVCLMLMLGVENIFQV